VAAVHKEGGVACTEPLVLQYEFCFPLKLRLISAERASVKWYIVDVKDGKRVLL
jgi:hypothetical protein